MSDQLSFLPPSERPKPPKPIDEAGAARDEALERVEINADPEWNDDAFEAVLFVARYRDTFSTEHVWQTGLRKPREPRAMGPVMIRALREQVCVKAGYSARSDMVSRHAAPVMMYRSLLFTKYHVDGSTR